MIDIKMKDDDVRLSLIRYVDNISFEYDEVVRHKCYHLLITYLKVLFFYLLIFPLFGIIFRYFSPDKFSWNNFIIIFAIVLLVVWIPSALYFRYGVSIIEGNKELFKSKFYIADCGTIFDEVFRIIEAEDKNLIISNLHDYDKLVDFCSCIVAVNDVLVSKNKVTFFRYHDKWLRLDIDGKSKLLYGVSYIFDKNIEIPQLIFKSTGDIVFVSNRKVSV